MKDYIVFWDNEQNNMRYYWVGIENGCLSPLPEKAKNYKTWEAANKACKRIKRWNCQFMSWQDYQDWLDEGKREAQNVS